jgi:ParB-like chromosome segregation protein Spo0J
LTARESSCFFYLASNIGTMKSAKMVPIKSVKLNPKNPRVIKDDKFKKLVNSIKEFPKMLQLRPIVVNKSNIVLGGNQRLKACIEAGLKEIPVLMAEDLSKAEQERFIIADNVNFGDWDIQNLEKEWDLKNIKDWGIDVNFSDDKEKENPKIEKIFMDYYILKINFKTEKELIQAYNKLKEEYECEIIM